MTDEEVICPPYVCVGVIADRTVHVMKNGIFITVQVVLLEPLARSSKERSQSHLDDIITEFFIGKTSV